MYLSSNTTCIKNEELPPGHYITKKAKWRNDYYKVLAADFRPVKNTETKYLLKK